MPVCKTVHVAELDAGQVVKSARVSLAEFSASSRKIATASSSCNRSQTAQALMPIGFGMRPSRTIVSKRVTPTPTYSAAAGRLRQRGRHPGGSAQLLRGRGMNAAPGTRPAWVENWPRTGRLLDTAKMSCFLQVTTTTWTLAGHPPTLRLAINPPVMLCANARVDELLPLSSASDVRLRSFRFQTRIPAKFPISDLRAKINPQFSASAGHRVIAPTNYSTCDPRSHRRRTPGYTTWTDATLTREQSERDVIVHRCP
jgi:hypothetical protein